MTNKKIWLGMLVMALVFGMTVVGCDFRSNDDLNDDRPMGPQWTMVSNSPFGSTSQISGIAYGDGKFIAVDFGRIAYSTDGANWSLVNNLSPSIHSVTIVYGDGKWVTDDSYSTDGLNWNAATNTPSISLPKIAYGNGKFVAAGSQNKMAYSTDGQTWIMVSNPPFVIDGEPGDINGIVYGGGKFIAVGYRFITSSTVSSRIAYSTDGISWTSVSPAIFSNNTISCIAYGGGKFVASSSNATAYSTDGISWAKITENKMEGNSYSAGSLRFDSVAYGNNKWIGLRSHDVMGYSSDGINWTPAFNTPDITFPKATYGNGKFVVVGANGQIAYSSQ